MAKKQQAWDYQDTDTPKSFEAFQVYRDMGVNRSLEAVGRKLAKSGTIISRWSHTYNWVSRVVAYEQYLASEKSKADEAEREDERAQRREIVRFQTQLTKKQGGKISKAIDDPNKADPTPAEIKAFLNNAETALEQSRKEYNDLPTKRTELVDESLLKSVLGAIKKMDQDPVDIFNEIIAMAKEHDS